MSIRAVWNGEVLAEADENQVEVVEGNVYFPPEAVKSEALLDSERHSRCYWKGNASYYHLTAGGAVNKDAAWTYPKPKRKATFLKDYVAFWRGVRIEQD